MMVLSIMQKNELVNLRISLIYRRQINNSIMRRYKIIIAATLISTLPSISFAQEKILTDKVEITKSYLPEIGKAKKRDVRPSEEKSVSIEIPELEYKITYTPERYPFTFTQLTAPSYKINKEEELNKGYLEAGIGLPISSELQFSYGSTSGVNSLYAVTLNHNGFWGKIEDQLGEKQSATTTENSISALYEYRDDNMRVKFNLSQSYDKYNRYGYNTLSPSTSDNLNQHFLKSIFNAEVGSVYDETKKFNFNAYGQVNFVVDDYSYSETTYKAGVFLSHILHNFSNRVEGSVELISSVPSRSFLIYPNNSFESYTPPTDSFGATTSSYSYSPTCLLSIAPHYVFKYYDVDIKAGVNLLFNFNGTTNNYKQGVCTIIPEIRLAYNIANGGVTPYILIDGEYQLNNYFSLSELNPYIMEGLTAPNTVLRRYVGGVEGNIDSNLSYKLEAGVRDVKDLLMFINIEEGNVFSTIQSDFSNFEFLAELGYTINDELHLDFGFNYIAYAQNEETDEVAIGYSPFTANINAYYKVTKELTLEGGIKYMSGRYFGEEVNDEVSLYSVNGCVDLTLKGSYMLGEKFGVQLKLSNLLNQELYQYSNYKGVGISAIAGINYRF